VSQCLLRQTKSLPVGTNSIAELDLSSTLGFVGAAHMMSPPVDRVRVTRIGITFLTSQQTARLGFSMSATVSITDLIRQYRAGVISKSALVSDLSNREYAVPSYMAPDSPPGDMNSIEETNHFQPGTWGEVQEANDQGLLSDDEFNEIYLAVTQPRRTEPDSH
jgi:hypothetical protein